MRLQGLTDPYVLLTEPPEDYAKLRPAPAPAIPFRAADGAHP